MRAAAPTTCAFGSATLPTDARARHRRLVSAALHLRQMKELASLIAAIAPTLSRQSAPSPSFGEKPRGCRGRFPQMRIDLSIMNARATCRVGEAAALLGVSDDTIRRWAEAGRLTLTGTPATVDGVELAALAQELGDLRIGVPDLLARKVLDVGGEERDADHCDLWERWHRQIIHAGQP